jgi:two-component system, NarL family, response regulator LiaR
MSGPIRVLIVDDHRVFAEALEMLLAGEANLEVIGAVGSAEEALEVIVRASPEVALVDMHLPGMDGIDATREIREASPSTQVLITTALQDPAEIARALTAGACGFIARTQTVDDLVGMIRRAAAGDLVLPSEGLQTVLATLQSAQRVRSNAERRLGLLTSREMALLELIAEGLTTREVAERFSISQLTVQTHVKNILAKLGVRSKLEAVTFALRHRAIRIPGPGTGK